MNDLIEKLENAISPDGALDDDLAKVLGWTFTKMKGDARPYWRKPGETAYYMRIARPNFTASIDAALTLVPENWDWSVSPSEACVSSKDGRFLASGDREFYARHAVPAIALCIAVLRARSSEPTP